MNESDDEGLDDDNDDDDEEGDEDGINLKSEDLIVSGNQYLTDFFIIYN